MARLTPLRKSARLSFWEGIASAAQAGLTDNFLTPYALALKATVPQIGILASFPQFFGAVAQLACGRISDWLQSRKRLIVMGTLAHAFVWLPILAIPWAVKEQGIKLLVPLVALAFTAAGLAGPAWLSLLSQYVSPSRRGHFFGTRAALVGLTSVVTAFLAGAVLHLFRDRVFVGFSLLFAGAFVFRSASALLLSRLYEPRRAEHRIRSLGLFEILRAPEFRPYWGAALFLGAMHAAVHLSAPYIAVYLLRDVGTSYPQYTAVMLAAAISSFTLMRPWGRMADRLGNARVLRFCGFCVALIPFLWLVSPHLWVLVPVQIFAGGVWAGFTLSASNYILDAVAPQDRTRCIALFNVSNGAGIFIGAFLGGQLVPWLPRLFGHKILTVFLISAAARLVVWIFLSGLVREVRPVRPLVPGEGSRWLDAVSRFPV